jgi:asparagine synthase (glutamine-hydrolysing)
MCGIYDLEGKPVEEGLILAMREEMIHRGPDDVGHYTEGILGLGHRRLSIIDLSEHGHQPMFNEDQSLAIVYNGEIYNHLDLRCQLEKKGHLFTSHSDTEVLLHGYEEWGKDLLPRLNGMFAFAIWDSKEKELFLARDRIGIKPLYYYQDQKRFLFASEIKPLLSAGVPVELDPSVTALYLGLRYSPGETSFFKGIKKLPPGCWAKVDSKGLGPVQTWWNLLDNDRILPYSQVEAEERFYELLEDAVFTRLIADVPIGAFLSGGIDSSAIAALMSNRERTVNTFTFGFGLELDEVDEARRIAQEIGVKNASIYLNKDDFHLYPKVLRHLEEPLGDSIILPTFLLAQRAAQDVKVVLLGDGADEILGGYVHHLAMVYGDLAHSLLGRRAFSALSGLAGGLPQVAWEKFFVYPAAMGGSGVKRVLNYFKAIDSPGQAYMALGSAFNEEDKAKLLTSDFYASTASGSGAAELYGDYFERSRNPDFQNRLLQLDLKYWNVDFTLLRMDKLTMAHSLEARVPFLDHRLVELCLRLPRRFKTRRFNQKLLMRGALKNKNILPERVVRRRKKSFFFPLEKGFDHSFFDFANDTLSEGALKRRGIFNPSYVKDLLGNGDRELIHNKQLMVVLAFELWACQFLDNEWKT